MTSDDCTCPSVSSEVNEECSTDNYASKKFHLFNYSSDP